MWNRECDKAVLECTAGGLCEEMLNPSTEVVQEELAPLQKVPVAEFCMLPQPPHPGILD